MSNTYVHVIPWFDYELLDGKDYPCLPLPLEKKMATHSSILAWKIPGTEELGGYSPWGHRGSDTTEWLSTHTCLCLFSHPLFVPSSLFCFSFFPSFFPSFHYSCLLHLVLDFLKNYYLLVSLIIFSFNVAKPEFTYSWPALETPQVCSSVTGKRKFLNVPWDHKIRSDIKKRTHTTTL